ncbi:MAG: hypothetical protein KDC84_15040 [Crocinitomicaceae bacterium]|nr:hypothetical protein [Crocinitomicaceae bacterium]
MKTTVQIKFILLIIQLFVVELAYSQRYQTSEEIISFCEQIDQDMRYVGELNLDSVPSLPIGIHKNFGEFGVTIAIDSANFHTNGAFFDAYMALEIPGMRNKLAFRATNIQFNPKGVIGGALSRLMLVSEHTIEMGPNINLVVPGDGTNYVEWDCNGFKAVNLKGIFEFSESIFEPIDGKEKVEASFEVYASDIRNILITTSISPFQLKGKKDFQFYIQDAVVDLSDEKNPNNAVFPSQYHEIYPSNINLWRGFYLKGIEIVLPESLSKGGERISIGANDLIIDNAGFSGEIFVNNLITREEGSMSGWPFSVTHLEVDFVCNKVVGGGIEGEIHLPPVEQSDLAYEAEIHENASGNLDYHFLVSFSEPLVMGPANAEFQLHPSSYLEVNVIDDRFLPKMVINGELSIKRNKTEIVGMDFQNITFLTTAPFITDGVFELTVPGDSSKMENFNIQLDRFYIHFSETAPVFGADVRLNLGKKPSDNSQSGLSLSVSSGFKIFTKITNVPKTEYEYYDKQEWQFDRFEISSIGLELKTGPMHLQGVLAFRRNDPDYGDGFYGSIFLAIEHVLDQPLTATFMGGKVDGFRYWFVDITAPIKIPLVGGVNINKIRGGASYHVEDTRSIETLVKAANQGSFAPPNAYLPNEEVGLSLRAGVGLDWANESIANADVLFSITFNSSGGLRELYFMGNIYCLVPRSARFTGNNKVKGAIVVHYDNMEKILDAQIDAEVNFSNVVQGNMNMHMYFSPDLWFVKLNTPSNPANVNLLGLAYINTYLMVGQNLEPSMPPPQMVMDLVGIQSATSRDPQAILTGDGFAHGSRVQMGGELSLGWQSFSIYGSLDVGAGYDLTIYNYGPNAHCQGEVGPIGMRGWYLQGQVYAYIGFALGIRGKIGGTNYDIKLLEAYLAMYLAGKLPKPTYVEGGVGVRATVIGIFTVNFHLNFSLGDDCQIVQT